MKHFKLKLLAVACVAIIAQNSASAITNSTLATSPTPDDNLATDLGFIALVDLRTGQAATIFDRNAQGNRALGIALGSNNQAASGSTVLGNGNQVADGGLPGVAIGNFNKATSLSVAVGIDNDVSTYSAIGIGVGSIATGSQSIAIGRDATASVNDSIAIGTLSKATNANDVAIGKNSTTNTAPSTGAFTINGGTAAATTFTNGAFSVGAAGKERQIQNVGAGSVTALSTDAINGSQLFAVGTSLNNLGTTTASALGGGSTFDKTTGNLTAPSILLNGNATAFTNVSSAIQSLASGGAGPLQFTTAGTPSNGLRLVGAAATPVTLGNVANGVGNNDAVNFGQLSATNTNVTNAQTTATNAQTTATNANKGFKITTAKAAATTTGSVTGNTVTQVAPDSTVTATAGDNIAVTQNGANLTFATVAAPSFTSVTAGNSKLDNSGLTITNGTDVVSVTSAGINAGGKPITGLAAAPLTAGSTAAVTGDQLNTTNNAIAPLTTAVNSLNSGAGFKYFHANSTDTDSTATGTDSVAIGPSASAVGEGSFATGISSIAQGKNSLALGQLAIASGEGDVALGAGSLTAPVFNTKNTTVAGVTTPDFAGSSATSTVSVGGPGTERTITNVGAGRLDKTSTDAINGSQLWATNQLIAGSNDQLVAITTTTPDGFTGFQDNHNKASPTTLSGFGIANRIPAGPAVSPYSGLPDPYKTVSAGLALGQVNQAWVGSVTVGSNNKASAQNAIAPAFALGNNNLASGPLSAAFGAANNATGVSSLALGVNNSAGGVDSVAIGRQATANFDRAIAQGTLAIAANANDVALGAFSKTSAPSAGPFTINGGTPAATTFTNGTFSVGDAGKERQIQNVGAGSITATSTDAVNGSQLFAVGNAVNNLSSGTGGLIRFADPANPSNNFTLAGPAAGPVVLSNVAPGTATNDAVNFGQINPLITTVNNLNNGAGFKFFHANSTQADSTATGTDSLAIGPSASATGNGDVALGAGSLTSPVVNTKNAIIAGVTTADFAGSDAKSTVSVGSLNNERTITNVGAGRIDGSSTDAVNGSQLFAVGNAVNNLSNGNAGLVRFADPGTPSNSFTLAGADPNAPVTLGNVAAGTKDNDAVNFAQFSTLKNAADVATADVGALKNGTEGTVQVGGPDGGLKLVNPDGSTGPVKLGNVADGALDATSKEAVNGGQLLAVSQVADLARNGFTLATSQTTGVATGAPAQVPAGSTVTVNAGDNIVLTQDATKLTIATSANPSFSSVTTGNSKLDDSGLTVSGGPNGNTKLDNSGLTTGNSKLDNSGLTITGGPSVTDQGIDAAGKKISNLGAGTSAGDVVNFAQLRDVAERGAQAFAPIQYSTPATANTPTPDGSISNDATLVGADKTKPVQLHNVGQGQVAAGSTDAFNGGQAFAAMQSTADALGGGASVSKDGQLTSPSYRIGGQNYTSVGSAFGAVDRSLGKLQDQVNGNRLEARRGIAAAVAMPKADMPTDVGAISYAGQYGTYRGEDALGAAFAYRVDAKKPFAITAGVSYAGGDDTAGTVGFKGQF